MDPHDFQSRFKLHSLPPTIPTPTGPSPYSPYRGMFGGYGGQGGPARFSPQLRYPPLLSRHVGPGLVRPEYIPPPPPLLKLGQHQHNIPPVSQQFYNTTTTNSPLTSHLIGLLRQPTVSSLTPSTPSSPPSPGLVPLTISDAVAVSVSPSVSSSSSTLEDRDHPVVSEESDFSNIEPSNASKCKEYRERNKQKRRKGEEEYEEEYEKYKKLKATYDRQKKSIKRLKEYYLKILKKGELTCPRAKKAKTDDDNENKEDGASGPSDDIEPPLVTIKTEIELNVADIIVKNEC